MIKADELANSLQVCLDSGAKKVLLPITSAPDLGSVPAELVGCFNLISYQTAEDAVFKALGVEKMEEQSMDKSYSILESSVRETLASVVWSHKIQEKQADICSNQFKVMETAKIVSASMTSVGIVSLIFTDQLWLKIVSALLSFISVFVSAFFKSFDLQTMVSQHKAAANNLLAIRDELKLIILQIHLEKDEPTALYEKYEDTVHQLDKVYADAPNTSDKAVAMARVALNITQDNTFSDEEIDHLLPDELKKGV